MLDGCFKREGPFYSGIMRYVNVVGLVLIASSPLQGKSEKEAKQTLAEPRDEETALSSLNP